MRSIYQILYNCHLYIILWIEGTPENTGKHDGLEIGIMGATASR